MIELSVSNAEFTPYHRGITVRDAEDKNFIAWDGEGITPPGNHQQNFVLFGNSLGYKVTAEKLTTLECLNVIIETERDHPNDIHVGFAFSYDTEMMLCDLELRHLHQLYRRGVVRWNGFRIEYRKNKWLQITKYDKSNDIRVSARIWDVWSFFSTSFVKAIEEYLGDIPELTFVREGKDARGSFTYADLESFVTPYWQTELKLLVDLMISLRGRLYGAGLKIRQWHGPGAIATYAMRNQGTKKQMNRNIPSEVNDAAAIAYAGGRFELFRMGWNHSPVYAYDIRSAYPSAIAKLPNLSTGSWRYVREPKTISRFGVYHIIFRNAEIFSRRPMPYFYRDDRSAIHYPNFVDGWYWSPEARMARYLGDDCKIVEGWVYDDDGSSPLEWVREIYNTRAEWKAAGNPSQLALKLLLNSMYGKMAQRVGWEKTGNAPTWHQLEWAGWVTSYARAMLFRAMIEAHSKNSLIGVETDGVFSSQPLNLDIGGNLGQWESVQYDEMIYLQSGFYFINANGEWKAKYRGFDKGSVNLSDVQSSLEQWKPWEGMKGTISGTTTRFSSMGLYLRIPDGRDWRNVWMTSPRDLSLGNDGKRVHRSKLCPECQKEHSPADEMHSLTIAHPIGGTSQSHIIPWKESRENPFRELITEIGEVDGR